MIYLEIFLTFLLLITTVIMFGAIAVAKVILNEAYQKLEEVKTLIAAKEKVINEKQKWVDEKQAFVDKLAQKFDWLL